MSDPDLHERITRSLAYMLRHQPEKFDVDVDPYGFADLGEVVRALNEKLGEAVSEEDVRAAVEGGDRPRYEIEDGRIRALYGHSIPVEPGETAKPPELLYVAIPERDVDRARRYGLRGGRRRFVHLALTEEEAREAGRRAARDYTLLTVRALDAWEEGVDFYDRRSLFLADEVPTHHIEVGPTHHDGEPPLRERGGRDASHERAGRDFGRRAGRDRGAWRDDEDRGEAGREPDERDEERGGDEERDERRDFDEAREGRRRRGRRGRGRRGRGREEVAVGAHRAEGPPRAEVRAEHEVRAEAEGRDEAEGDEDEGPRGGREEPSEPRREDADAAGRERGGRERGGWSSRRGEPECGGREREREGRERGGWERGREGRGRERGGRDDDRGGRDRERGGRGRGGERGFGDRRRPERERGPRRDERREREELRPEPPRPREEPERPRRASPASGARFGAGLGDDEPARPPSPPDASEVPRTDEPARRPQPDEPPPREAPAPSEERPGPGFGAGVL